MDHEGVTVGSTVGSAVGSAVGATLFSPSAVGCSVVTSKVGRGVTLSDGFDCAAVGADNNQCRVVRVKSNEM